jgi:hypothetical protein
MKLLIVFLAASAIFLFLSLPSVAFAQSTQVSYTVNLNSFSLRVTYPSEVMPGGTLNVSVQGTPKTSSVYLQNLTATVYYADAAGMHQLASQTLISNPVSSYGYGYSYTAVPTGSFINSFTVNVPQDAPRTSLVAVFSETTQYYNSYMYFPYYYGPYPYTFGFTGGALSYYYPSYNTATDQAISPLSYIKAATPEYVALQSQYQTLQQQLTQIQSQNQQQETTITQQSAMINQLNQQLSSANSATQAYEIIAITFIVIAVAFAALSISLMRSKAKMKSSEAKDTTQPTN